jgi:hypothetical protein
LTDGGNTSCRCETHDHFVFPSEQLRSGVWRLTKFCRNNNVTLPDEYDQIDRDLLPFRSLSPTDLNRRLDRIRKLPGTYTLRVEHGSLATSKLFDEEDIDGAKERVEGQVRLILPIAEYLEDFTAVYWVHDTPSGLISYNHRKELLNYLDEEECESSIVGISLGCRRSERHCDGST